MNPPSNKKQIIVGVTGASGAIYARRLIECLCDAGSTVHLVVTPNGTRLLSQGLDARLLEEADCVLVVTDHTGVDYDLVARHGAVIVDTRNALKDIPGDHIHRL